MLLPPTHRAGRPGRPRARLAFERLEDRTTPSAGSLDLAFGTNGKVITDFGSGNVSSAAMTLQPDGKIVQAGSLGTTILLARFLPSGALDTTFSGDGKATVGLGVNAAINDVLIQPDGKILLAGFVSVGTTNADFVLLRFLPSGTLDTSFGGDGEVTTDFGAFDTITDITLLPNGRIVAAGSTKGTTTSHWAVARYLPDGTLDSDFDADGRLVVNFAGVDAGVVALPDGRFILGGGPAPFTLARFLPDGTLDTSFGTGGIASTAFQSGVLRKVILLGDGRLLAVGNSSLVGSRDFALARYLPGGTLDTSFGNGGTVVTDFAASDDAAFDVAVQVNGKIVAVGQSDAGGSSTNYALARYLPDGTLDTSFSNDGKVLTDFNTSTDEGNSVAIQADGQILAGGRSAGTIGGDRDLALARYDGDPVARITVSDYVVQEGSPASPGGIALPVNAGFTVRLSEPLDVPVAVNFTTRNGTAVAGSDYTTTSGGIIFGPGATTVTVLVPILSDLTDEDNETFFFDLSNAVGALIADPTGQATVVDDDGPSSSLSGFVYADSNFNSTRDPGETGISGVTVELYKSITPAFYSLVTTTTTSSTGQYTFNNLTRGTYRIAERQPSTLLDLGEQLGLLGGTVTNDTFSDIPIPAGGVSGTDYNFGEFPVFNFNVGPLFPNRSITSPIDEGGMATLTGTAFDANPHDRYILDIDWGDDSPPETRHIGGSGARDVRVEHRYAESGTYTVHLAWHDQDGLGNSGDLQVVVNNVPPQLLPPGDVSVGPNGLLQRPVKFEDPGADSWAAVIDYGDGTVEQLPDVRAGVPFQLRHTYSALGTYHVTVAVIDDDGDIGTTDFSVTVRGA